MNDLAELLAESSVDQPPLRITRDSAVAAGRRAVRRRRYAAGAVAAGAVLVLAAGALALPRAGTPGLPVGAPSATTSYPIPQLPTAAGVPGAVDRPDLVGSDPRLLHFAIGASSWPLGSATYHSGAGTESLQAGGLDVTVSRSQSDAEVTANPRVSESVGSPTPGVDGMRVDYSSGPGTVPGTVSRTPTTVQGRPATLISITFPSGTYPFWGLLWQPVDGLWVGLSTQTVSGVDEMWRDVDALRLDRAQHCVVPFQLAALPAGAHLLGCTAGVPGSDPRADSAIEVGDGHGNTASISIGQASVQVNQDGSTVAPPVPNREVNKHPVAWVPGVGFVADDYDGVPLHLSVSGDYDEAVATQILAGLVVSTDLAKPASWPADPAPAGR